MNQQQVNDRIPLLTPQQFNEIVAEGHKRLQIYFSQQYPGESQPICERPEKSFLTEGGTDPLDFIYVFKNVGDKKMGVPRHWHYIGLGLSDIHGYNYFWRSYEHFREQNPAYAEKTAPLTEMYPRLPPGKEMNGYGFELTFRLKCNSEEDWTGRPPIWPQQIMQSLARYVFQSRNTFSVGDHVAWHNPLDNENSIVQHILMTLDPQLKDLQNLPFGPIKFIQIVGVSQEELQSARQWNVRGILELMKEREETGGPFLVTDMRRGESIFQLNPEYRLLLEEEIKRTGSDMAQISAKHKTSSSKPSWFIETEERQKRRYEAYDNGEGELMLEDTTASILNSMPGEEEISDLLEMDRDENKMNSNQDYPVRTPSRMSQGSESALKIENAALLNVRYYDNIYILLNYESAKVLPIMLNGRLSHKRHFSFQSFKGDSLITFQPEGSQLESLVRPEFPIARQGSWLQIYVSNDLCRQMSESLKDDFDPSMPKLKLPKNYSWPDHNLHLTIVNEILDY